MLARSTSCKEWYHKHKIMIELNVLKCFHKTHLMLKPLSWVMEDPYTLNLSVSLWLILFFFMSSLFYSGVGSSILKSCGCVCLCFPGYPLSSSCLLSHTFPRVQFTPFILNRNDGDKWCGPWKGISRQKQHAYLVSSLDQLMGEISQRAEVVSSHW